MIKALINQLLGGDRKFIAARGLSLVLTLVFAFAYSKQLGVERKGLLTFIITSNLVFSILLISGLSLHVRNLIAKTAQTTLVLNYTILIIISSFLTPWMSLLLLNLYQEVFDVSIPANLTLVVLIYCFFATLNFGSHDLLLMINSIRIVMVLDLAVVIIQILSYAFLLYAGETTFFISILLSFVFSHLTMTFATFVLIVYSFESFEKPSFVHIKSLLKISAALNFATIATQIVERVDKIFLGLQTSSADLGRYSINQSMLNLSRFLPESFAKLSLLRDRNFLVGRFRTTQIAFFSLALVSLLTISASFFVRRFLGETWVLALSVVFLMGIVEVFRGIYSLLSINAVRSYEYVKLRNVALVQLVLGFVFQPLFIHYFGILGSVYANLLVALSSIFFLRYYFDK